MKNIAIIATFCVAAAFAALVAKDVDVLIERAEKLVADAQKVVKEHIANDRAHLLSTVENDVKDLEKVVAQLKSLEKNVTTRTHQLNLLEEDLLRSENRLNEEFEFVEDVYKNHNAANKTANELIEYAQVLLKQAQAEITKHQAHGHREVVNLEYEVKSIETVLKRLQANPTGVGSKYDEQTLIRHEKTLRALIQRLQHA